MVTVLVTVAAGIGAVCRYLVDAAVRARTKEVFPAGTLVVNVSGSFLLGLIAGWTAHHGLGTHTALVLGAGFAGGFTTLSTWAWETFALADGDATAAAALNVFGSLGLGMLTAAAGLGLALLG